MGTKPATAADTKPERWDLAVHLVGDEVRSEAGWPTGIKVGHEVRFMSPDGKVKVEFKPLDPSSLVPFGAKGYEGAEEFHTVVNACKFTVYCYIKPDGKDRFIGWGPDDPKAGMTGGTTGSGH